MTEPSSPGSPADQTVPSALSPPSAQPAPSTALATTAVNAPAPEVARPRRPLVRISARLQILGWVVLLLALANVAVVLLQRGILLDRVDDQVTADLRQEVDEVRRLAAGRDPDTGEPFLGDAAAIFDTFLRRNLPLEGEAFFTFVAGRPYLSSAGAPARLDADPELAGRWGSLTSTEQGEVATDAGPARYLAVPLLAADGTAAGTFVVAEFLDARREDAESAVRISAVVSIVVLAVVSVLAWIIAGRVLRPVRLVTEAARSITETDLRRRLPVRGSGRDEIAELTTTFNDMLDRLDTAFVGQRAFLDNAGHELRTPITIVRGHLELMDDDPAERAATVALVNDELDRMTRIVDDLLLLARSDRPDFLDLGPVDLRDLTSDVLAKASALGDHRWALDGTTDGVIVADRHRLTQAMVNLAANAVNHADATTIGIGSARSGDEVRLWVRDDGHGIDAGDHDRVFERFARGGDRRRRSEGAGLGLSIVAAIAHAHGGRVELASSAGQGARFTIVLPDPGPGED
ncbi:ATP-binding protein [soil metagenome]